MSMNEYFGKQVANGVYIRDERLTSEAGDVSQVFLFQRFTGPNLNTIANATLPRLKEIEKRFLSIAQDNESLKGLPTSDNLDSIIGLGNHIAHPIAGAQHLYVRYGLLLTSNGITTEAQNLNTKVVNGFFNNQFNLGIGLGVQWEAIITLNQGYTLPSQDTLQDFFLSIQEGTPWVNSYSYFNQSKKGLEKLHTNKPTTNLADFPQASSDTIIARYAGSFLEDIMGMYYDVARRMKIQGERVVVDEGRMFNNKDFLSSPQITLWEPHSPFEVVIYNILSTNS